MTAISFYISSVKSELIKLKNTSAFWLTIITALLFPVLFFTGYFFMHKKLAPLAGVNPWEQFITSQIQSFVPFFIPMFIVLIASLIMQIEHKSLGLKYVFAQPVPKWSVYFGKLTIVIFAIFTIFILNYSAIVLSGLLLGLIHSDLAFLNFQPEHLKNIKLLGNVFLACLGIIGIQFWLSFRFKNFIFPLGFGVFLAIIGVLIVQLPEAIYFPYSFCVLSVSGVTKVPLLFGVSSVTVFSSICFAVTAVLGYVNIAKRNIS
ncbi:ABC transporter permease [Flavobacterium sp. FlaQc-48]|uniref:ABC transporter permease n=1 Tax=Flavobacterium sp. FlaQc-48 TaxID=3374181 RepID=UPI003757CE5E